MTYSMDPAVPPVTFERIEMYDKGTSIMFWRCTDGRHTVYGTTRGAAMSLLMNMRATPQTITGEVLEAIRELLAYNWQSEQADYEEHQNEGHIFLEMLRIQEWLGEVFS